jgi:hypothetical protein
MTRAIAVALLCGILFSSHAQIRVGKLIIGPRETYVLDSTDILVADSLIMMDSSRIRLNRLKAENFIRARVAIIGQNCRIDGRGVPGKKGMDGTPGLTPIGPCRDGVAGRNGLRGLSGGPGVNLFLYIDKLQLNGKLIVNLGGGNGGDGGDGGHGGGGSPGTNQCRGGDGGKGGNGGFGGDGGRGGTLTIGGRDASMTKALIGSLLIVRNNGGSFGYGGLSGAGGLAGSAPAGNSGTRGQRGIDGQYGRPGEAGTVLFEKP